MTVNADIRLDEEQRICFVEAVEASLKIEHRSQLFTWLQNHLCMILSHEVMVFGTKKTQNNHYDCDFVTSTRYFTTDKFHQATDAQDGLIWQAFELWVQKQVPVFITADNLDATISEDFELLQVDKSVLDASELRNLVVCGFNDSYTDKSTMVAFGRVGAPLNANTAYILELVMPHLHALLMRVAIGISKPTVPPGQSLKRITRREYEILQWLQMGKTNWEISTILQISPLTVKNHVQNILRKLDVENRNQAAVKATKLGLASVNKPV